MDSLLLLVYAASAMILGFLIGSWTEECKHKKQARARAAKSRMLKKIGQSPKGAL